MASIAEKTYDISPFYELQQGVLQSRYKDDFLEAHGKGSMKIATLILMQHKFESFLDKIFKKASSQNPETMQQ